MKHLPLRLAIRQALLASTAISAAAVALLPTPARSQEGAVNLDRIEVTGSRIRSVDAETSQPVFVLTRQEIERQGYVTVEDIVSNLTAAGTAAINRATVLNSGTTAGGSYVNMRNLGITRTLVLVDGRRWGTNHQGSTDLATIPSAIIERIEVLKDGASAIYGSDAIAGVINIITRRDVDHAEFRGYHGQNGEGDGATQQYELTFGATGERSSLVLNATFAQVDPIWAIDRPLTRYSFGEHYPDAGLSPAVPYGVIIGSSRGTLVLKPGGDPTNIDDYEPLTEERYYNPGEQMMYNSATRRASIFAKGTYDLGDSVRFRADALFNERQADVQIAGFPLQSATSNSPDRLGMPIRLSRDSYYNPLPGEDLTFIRRTVEAPRVTDNTVRTFRVGGAIEGFFDIGGRGYNWDVSLFSNRNDGLSKTTGDINLLRLRDALGPSFMDTDGIVKCGTPGNVIAGCVPWNVLAGPGGMTPEVIDYLVVTSQRSYGSRTTGFSANLAGDLFSLPAGIAGFALGVEHREESGFEQPDQLTSSGYTSGNASGPTRGSYRVDEVYAELSLPLLSGLAGIQELELSLAGRYSDYSNFGDTTNGKFGLRWKPTDDVLVRASFSEGFRAPTISNLYAVGSQSYDFYTDPCDSRAPGGVPASCTAAGVPSTFIPKNAAGNNLPRGGQTPFPFRAGGNEGLKPESSSSKTLGLVYSPAAIAGLNVSVDWYNIRIENLIVNDTATYILNQCYLAGATEWCDRFERETDPDSPYYGQVISLDRSLSNRGWVETEGYDVLVRYQLPDLGFGAMSVTWDTNYLVKHESQSQAGAIVEQDVGWAPMSRVKSNLNFGWRLGDFGATWGMRYHSGLKEDCRFDDWCNRPDYRSPQTGDGLNPVNASGSVTFNDVQFHWNAPWEATVAVGVNNVFDRKGPYLYQMARDGFTSSVSYHPAYDIDRFWYVRYQQRF